LTSIASRNSSTERSGKRVDLANAALLTRIVDPSESFQRDADHLLGGGRCGEIAVDCDRALTNRSRKRFGAIAIAYIHRDGRAAFVQRSAAARPRPRAAPVMIATSSGEVAHWEAEVYVET